MSLYPKGDDAIPVYSVKCFYGGEFEQHLSFEGEGAFSEACEAFEAAKLDTEACEIWMTRLDGGEWKFVGKPIRRNTAGEWEEADE